MQAFAYRHLVPAKEFQGVVLARAFSALAPKLEDAATLKIPLGGKGRLKIRAAVKPAAGGCSC